MRRDKPELSRCIAIWSVLLSLAMFLLSSCGSGMAAGRGSPRPSENTATAVPAELVVFAATSLNEAFHQLAKEFEKDNPGTHVLLNLAGSQELRAQIEGGAPVDVFASANHQHVAQLHDQGLVLPGRNFAANELVIVVPQGNPAGVKDLSDLAHVERLIAAAPQVPIGNYTLDMLELAAAHYGPDFPCLIRARIASEELSARQVLHKVRMGEGDAGIVYWTDAVSAAEDVALIPIPTEFNARADYVITTATNPPAGRLSQRWITHVLSHRGQAVLAEFGFKPVEQDY